MAHIGPPLNGVMLLPFVSSSFFVLVGGLFIVETVKLNV